MSSLTLAAITLFVYISQLHWRIDDFIRQEWKEDKRHDRYTCMRVLSGDLLIFFAHVLPLWAQYPPDISEGNVGVVAHDVLSLGLAEEHVWSECTLRAPVAPSATFHSKAPWLGGGGPTTTPGGRGLGSRAPPPPPGGGTCSRNCCWSSHQQISSDNRLLFVYNFLPLDSLR